MGFFNGIDCQHDLPDGLEETLFQTKDMSDLDFDAYTITKTKKLLGPDGEPVDYHGYINFYKHINDVWHEYKAKFTDGELVEIKKIIEEEI